MMKKKFAAGLLSGALTLMLCLGLGTAVPAGEVDPAPAKATTAAITKELQMDTNVTTPDATFSFTVEKVSLDGDTTDTAKAAMPAIEGKSISITAGAEGTTPADSALKTVTGTTENIVPAATAFPHAGIYVYHIKETAGDATVSEGSMTYSQAEYDMTVAVVNDDTAGAAANSLKIDSVVVAYTKDDDGTEKTDKADMVKFVNKYEKESSLTISKTVAGALGDKTKQFEFKLSLSALSALEAEGTTYEGTITRADGTATEKVTLSKTEQTFTLADGDKLEFAALPVGTRYTVSETDTDEYEKAVVITAGGAEVTGTSKETNALVGEGTNSAAYTNTKETTVPTGIIVNNLPFIILILVAVCGFAGYIVFKRRSYKN